MTRYTMEPTIKTGLPAEALAKAGPREVFFHLLAIITLYISAVSFGALLFQYIDRFFPDPLIDYPRQISNTIRGAIAALVIVFPVYLWLSWRLRREEVREPERRELKIRKWLLYFTLFAASVVIIGDLVALLYNFLGGDLTTRFVLKVAAVFVIAAAVFRYYLWNLRRDVMASQDPRMRIFVFGTIAAVAIAAIAGFFVIGSPFEERARRFDERRVQNLQEIQWQVINYWQKKEKLPDSLVQLRDDISGYIPPADPESDKSYEYRVLDSLKFELCAEFKTASTPTDSRAPKPMSPDGRTPENWSHGQGRVCFERTIDPELYSLKRLPQ